MIIRLLYRAPVQECLRPFRERMRERMIERQSRKHTLKGRTGGCQRYADNLFRTRVADFDL